MGVLSDIGFVIKVIFVFVSVVVWVMVNFIFFELWFEIYCIGFKGFLVGFVVIVIFFFDKVFSDEERDKVFFFVLFIILVILIGLIIWFEFILL